MKGFVTDPSYHVDTSVEGSTEGSMEGRVYRREGGPWGSTAHPVRIVVVVVGSGTEKSPMEKESIEFGRTARLAFRIASSYSLGGVNIIIRHIRLIFIKILPNTRRARQGSTGLDRTGFGAVLRPPQGYPHPPKKPDNVFALW